MRLRFGPTFCVGETGSHGTETLGHVLTYREGLFGRSQKIEPAQMRCIQLGVFGKGSTSPLFDKGKRAVSKKSPAITKAPLCAIINDSLPTYWNLNTVCTQTGESRLLHDGTRGSFVVSIAKWKKESNTVQL